MFDGIIDPTVGPDSGPDRSPAVLAPRPDRLHGLALGLLANTKRNAEELLDALASQLEQEYGVKPVLARKKMSITDPVPQEILEELTAACDIVVTGVGDCGSCSASAVADGLLLEQAGVPAAVIVQRGVPGQRRRDGRPAGRPGLPVRHHRAPGRQPGPCWRARPRGHARPADRGPADRPRDGGALMTASLGDPVRDARAAVEYCYEQGWTDGLPVVPATEADVEEFLATTARDPGEVIGAQEHLRRRVTVAQAAANAVMAGCRAEYFPVVLAAWEALNLERATRGGAWQSTSGPAPLIVVNGPIRHRLGINSTGGVFGPGFRANATIARAIGLIVRNGVRHPPAAARPDDAGHSRSLDPVHRGERGDVALGAAERGRRCRTRRRRRLRDADQDERVRGQPAHGGPRGGAARPGRHAGPVGCLRGRQALQRRGGSRSRARAAPRSHGYGRADVQARLFELSVRSRERPGRRGQGRARTHGRGPRVPDDAVGRGDPGDRRRRRQRRDLDGLPTVRMDHVVRPLGTRPTRGDSATHTQERTHA